MHSGARNEDGWAETRGLTVKVVSPELLERLVERLLDLVQVDRPDLARELPRVRVSSTF